MISPSWAPSQLWLQEKSPNKQRHNDLPDAKSSGYSVRLEIRISFCSFVERLFYGQRLKTEGWFAHLKQKSAKVCPLV